MFKTLNDIVEAVDKKLELQINRDYGSWEKAPTSRLTSDETVAVNTRKLIDEVLNLYQQLCIEGFIENTNGSMVREYVLTELNYRDVDIYKNIGDEWMVKVLTSNGEWTELSTYEHILSMAQSWNSDKIRNK